VTIRLYISCRVVPLSRTDQIHRFEPFYHPRPRLVIETVINVSTAGTWDVAATAVPSMVKMDLRSRAGENGRQRVVGAEERGHGMRVITH